MGSMLRYLIGLGISRVQTGIFPYGTFAVNITGCFLIGLFYALAWRHSWMSAEWRIFLITGLCGGYTTFSSFSLESIDLLSNGRYLSFGLYVGLSIFLGLLATLAGYYVIFSWR